MTRSGADVDAPCPEESSCSAARCQRRSSVKHIWKSFSHGHSGTQLVLRAVTELSSNRGKGLTLYYVCSNTEDLVLVNGFVHVLHFYTFISKFCSIPSSEFLPKGVRISFWIFLSKQSCQNQTNPFSCCISQQRIFNNRTSGDQVTCRRLVKREVVFFMVAF